MTISHINAGRDSIIVVPASQLADDTLIEGSQGAVVLVYSDEDATAADAFAAALSQRGLTQVYPEDRRG